MRRILCGIILIFVALLAPSALKAQVATGVYPYGTFDTPGVDTINAGNLNVHLSVPVLNKTGRGLPFNANLTYDSSIYFPAGVNGSQTWALVPQFGWSSNTGLLFGAFSYSATGYDFQYVEPQYVGPPQNYVNVTVNCSWTSYSNWVFTDRSGVSHALGGQTMEFWGQDQYPDGFTCPTEDENQYSSGSANDGSGLVLSVSNYTQATVTAPNGTSTESSTGAAATETDSNGNQLSADGQGNFTDTTGHVVLRVTGNQTSAQIYTYYDTNGNPQTVTVDYSAYTVQTNFGCSGIGELGPTTKYLVSSISLPDGSSYHFSYEPTPGYSSNVTGRLASITVPQGNTINYAYTGGNNGIECADGSTAGLTRTTNSDSGSAATSLAYSRTITGSGTSQTSVVDGLQNNKIYTFAEPSGTAALYYETTRKIYQGPATGTPALSLTTCYNAATLPCTSQPTLPISQIDTYQLLNGIQMDGTETTINASGMTTASTVYDFGGSSSRGSALSNEQWTYGYSIPSLVTQDEVFDGNSNEAGNTTYSYDGGTLTTSSGVPQHVYVSGVRGNLTSVTQYANASTPYTTTSTYEDTGSVLTVTAPTGTTTLSYDPTFVYPTTVNVPTPSSGIPLSSSESYDTSNTGLPLTTTDPNGQVTTIRTYDAMLRPTEQDNPDGGKVTWSYTPTSVITDTYQSSSVYGQTYTQTDGYGRPSRTAVANGQSGNYWYQQDTCYDANGNVSFVSYRYQGAGFGAPKVCSGAGTTYTYDVLGRVTAVTQSNGETSTITYTGRATQTTDENGVKRISQVDGLGRTTVVCEISSNSTMPGSGSPTSCGTDIAGTGFTTNYSYALATGTTTVTQGTQTRTFQNDWLGRSISTTEPESGTTTYSYAYNGNPGLGLLVTRQKPQANQTNPSVKTTTTTQYDTLGRPVSVSYNDGLTPTKTFSYDSSYSWDSNQNHKGRLLTAFSNNNSTITTFGYDAMGRIGQLNECTPSNCGVSGWTLSYSYDWAGNLLTATDGFSGVTDTYTYSLANEVQSITSNLVDPTHPGNLVTSIQNGPSGPLNWKLGNNLYGVQSYDSLGRLNGGWVCNSSTSSQCSGGTKVYGFTAGWKGAQLQSSTDTVLNQTSSYGYDEFNRLKSRTVTSGTVQNLSWTYDRWGNRWSQTVTAGSGPQPSYSFNTANNQISSNGMTYDAAGNQTYDGAHHYTYDAEGNVLQVDSGATASYVYNALNQRVRVNTSGGAAQEFIYNAAGQRVSIWDPVDKWQVSGQTYWGSTPVEFYEDGYAQFQHKDWLGTMRVTTTNTGAVQGTYSSLPYGDAYTVSGADNDSNHFAQLDFDSGSGTDHAQFRQYSPTEGRWLRPDSYGGSYRFGDPQSLNRYEYAMNNPLSDIDPSGQDINCDEIQEDGSAWGGHSQNCVVSGDGPDVSPVTGYCTGDGCVFPGESATFNQQGEAAQMGEGSPDGLADNPFAQALFHGGGQAYWHGADTVVTDATIGYTSLIAGSFAVASLPAVPGMIASRVGMYYATASGTTAAVLGRFPEYLDDARAMGANALNIPNQLYNLLDWMGEGWTANQAFLDRVMATGQQIYLSSPPLGQDGSIFQEEMWYLTGRGAGADTWMMVPR